MRVKVGFERMESWKRVVLEEKGKLMISIFAIENGMEFGGIVFGFDEEVASRSCRGG